MGLHAVAQLHNTVMPIRPASRGPPVAHQYCLSLWPVAVGARAL